MTLQTPASLLRRGTEASGNDATTALKRSEAQELANATRNNTKRNKGTAVPVRSMLVKLKKDDGTESLASAAIQERKNGSKAVSWNDNLVSFFEQIEAGDVDAATDATATASEALSDMQSSKPADTSKPSKLRTTRRAKTLGAMNGTPAKPTPAAAPSKPSIPVTPTTARPTTSTEATKEAQISKDLITSISRAKTEQHALQKQQVEQVQASNLIQPSKTFVAAGISVGKAAKGTGSGTKPGTAPVERRIPAPVVGRKSVGADKENAASNPAARATAETKTNEKVGQEAVKAPAAAQKTRRSILPRYATRART